MIETIQFLRFRRFLRKIERVRNCSLHPKCQFVRFYPGLDDRVERVLFRSEAIKLISQLEIPSLFRGRHPVAWLGIIEGIIWIDL